MSDEPDNWPTHWIIYRIDGGDTHIEEVRGVMSPLTEPGDFGWVLPIRQDAIWPLTGIIADAHHLFPTREAAVNKHVSNLKEQIAQLTAELNHWEALR